MPALILLAPEPLAGKTSVAAGFAHQFAAQGRSVSLHRISGDPNAESDATLFGSLQGVLTDTSDVDVQIIEAPAGEAASSLAQFPDSRAIVIADASTPMDVLDYYCRQVGDRLVGTVLNKTPARRAELLLDASQSAGIDVLAAVPEDRVLAAPLLRDVALALSAQTEHFDGGGLRPLERPVIATISADPGQGYFARYDASAVIVRSDKPDLQLAALNAGADCLIVTGGLPILSYVLERAEEDETPLLRTSLDTIAAVEQIEAIFSTSPFAGGNAKIERISQLLTDLDLAALLTNRSA